MTTYGVTPEGFVAKPLSVVKSDVEGRLHSEVATELDLTAESALGQIHQILAEKIAQLWEVLEAADAARDPDGADDAQLDIICALTGTIRAGATKSTVTVDVTTDQAVSVAAGDFVASVDGNDAARFVNTGAITTAGADTVPVGFEAEETGAIVANAATLTVIETPVAGITGITNVADAALGSDIESNEDLRARREAELDAQGSGTIDSIRAKLLKLDDVEDVVVFENTGDVTDGSGRPPHSIHAVVLGGADADIIQELWGVKGGGIATHGAESGSATDSRGKPQTVYFDRATELLAYLEIDVDIIAAEYPADGDDQLAAALVAKGSTLGMGDDVVAWLLRSVSSSVSGIYDVTALRLGFDAPSPVGTVNLSVDETEIARFDTGRVVVTTNPVTP